MDEKNAPGLRNTGNRRGVDPSHSGSFRLVYVILGFALVVAGSLKLHQLVFETQDESLEALITMAFAEAELLFGLVMVVGFKASGLHPWIIAVFAGFAVASLSRGLVGMCSCCCFGSIAVNPWAVLVFDLAALTALLVWRPPADPIATPWTAPSRLMGIGFVGMAVLVVGLLQDDLSRLVGVAVANGVPLKEAAISFIGESGQIVVRTNRNGEFLIPFIRPGRYAVSIQDGLPLLTPQEQPSIRESTKRNGFRSKRSHPTRPDPRGGTALISWIEVDACSESNQQIEFQSQ